MYKYIVFSSLISKKRFFVGKSRSHCILFKKYFQMQHCFYFYAEHSLSLISKFLCWFGNIPLFTSLSHIIWMKKSNDGSIKSGGRCVVLYRLTSWNCRHVEVILLGNRILWTLDNDTTRQWSKHGLQSVYYKTFKNCKSFAYKNSEYSDL